MTITETARILKSSYMAYITLSFKYQQCCRSAVLTILQHGFKIDSDLDLTKLTCCTLVTIRGMRPSYGVFHNDIHFYITIIWFCNITLILVLIIGVLPLAYSEFHAACVPLRVYKWEMDKKQYGMDSHILYNTFVRIISSVYWIMHSQLLSIDQHVMNWITWPLINNGIQRYLSKWKIRILIQIAIMLIPFANFVASNRKFK